MPLGKSPKSVPHIKFDVKTKFHRYLDHCVLPPLPPKLQELWATDKPRAQEPWEDSHSHKQKMCHHIRGRKGLRVKPSKKKLIAAS